ncbi:MAG TPA: hypothetical protein VF163_22600 [Micromonosporaceae bacterium]
MKHVEVRSGVYRDSVQLMQISADLADQPQVRRALVAMATELNLDLMAGMGFQVPAGTGHNDMLVALDTDDEATVVAALARLDADLTGAGRDSATGADRPSGGIGTAAEPPRTIATATRGLAGPAVALVSTPGRYAFVEAMDALGAGLSVMVFSDNVPVDQEVRLKRFAAESGLLVMGPDCGTAIVSGLGLGFANVVRPGPVGLVAASGTGAQQVLSLLAHAGVGVSHCLGVGGRDLSQTVGGLATRAALDALDADPATELIVLIAKPPAPEVAAQVAGHAAGLRTPVVFAALGAGQPDLTTAVADVLTRSGRPVPTWPSWPASGSPNSTPMPTAEGGDLRGLFSGGTLCLEAMAVAAPVLGPIRSNIPLDPQWTAESGVAGHLMLDLGDDQYTVGRPHPMIDFGPRLEQIAAAADDPTCRVLLLDVVLGLAAHPDPASALVPAIASALAGRTTPLSIVVALIGTEDDPQGLVRQATALSGAGAHCHLSNAAAARQAAALAAGGAR